MTMLDAVTTVKMSVHTRDRLKVNAAGRFRTLGDYIDYLVDEDERRQRMAILAEQIRNTPEEVMAEYRQEAKIWEQAEWRDVRW